VDRIASVYIATSLDGFIAREDGDIDWLNAANEIVPEGEDCGFFAFMDSVDGLVMGRHTYEKVLSFGQWPYGEKPVIVLSRNEVKMPDSLPKIKVRSKCATIPQNAWGDFTTSFSKTTHLKMMKTGIH